MQPTHSSMFSRTSAGTSPRVTTSETANAAAGLQHAERLAQHAVFVARKIDDAIGDDHVDRIVGQRDVFDFAFEKLDVFDAGFALVLAREREHFVGHIETVGFPGGPDAARGQAARRYRRPSRDRAPFRLASIAQVQWDCRSRARPAPLLAEVRRFARRRRGLR